MDIKRNRKRQEQQHEKFDALIKLFSYSTNFVFV